MRSVTLSRASATAGTALTILLMVMAPAPAVAGLVTINFDDVVVPPNPSQLATLSGNQYASQGVIFTSGTIPNSVVLNQTITFTNGINQFLLQTGLGAITPPNFALATFETTNPRRSSLLMSFTAPVTSVQLSSDHFQNDPDGGNLIRLLALAPTGNPSEFQVVALTEALDNAETLPSSLLSVSLPGNQPFSFALFQVTTGDTQILGDPEGFDNLQFLQVVPEPSSLALLTLGAAGMAGWRRWRKRGA